MTKDAANNHRTSMDPVRYEMFLHRLWAIGEEGRMTLQRVTASPIVSQGGECMSSFYDAQGLSQKASPHPPGTRLQAPARV